VEGFENGIDPNKWQPLIMNMQKLHGVSAEEAAPSCLAAIERPDTVCRTSTGRVRKW